MLKTFVDYVEANHGKIESLTLNDFDSTIIFNIDADTFEKLNSDLIEFNKDF
jgi:hypothetical protein